ncbi:double-strand break repair protein AddB [Ponticaulis sp.]|uniref:double-strand break repair protein AddB n=1 Tax=Ponticaulis sp. TaxID=2020902 RepID=UPI000B768C9C|nr:double-strand break repair protein AddB [Ponticaulis sp.]MAI91640.1 double-strand break repair protein AddB [Ponticaulis sp.]OUX97206.1 MAG: double-strand break repair protein AddB [Hyphomonadaceae bacterium TMED5]|tara:strand:+ start:31650 stop:34748 length:3099 start_codon:yes stop_codon:yes gene_type:complete
MIDLKAELFGQNRAYTLPAGANFLKELAITLIEVTGARTAPEKLSDALIFLPNRRSARALAAHLHAELASPGFLPPDIRPLGDAGDNDPALLGELANIDVRPEMPSGTRLGMLAKLVTQWHNARGEPLTIASALSVAKDLARLLDQAALAGGVRWEDLRAQVQDKELAQHWEVSVDFLSIITENWPTVLAENGYSDTNARDRLAAEALCHRWSNTPPDTPVIVAGSTGSTPSTRMLMRAAMELPQGAVLFPGLEHETDEATWKAISITPSHPQFGFSETLTDLGLKPSEVHIWPGYRETEALTPRRQIIQESLAPADTTADWVTRLEMRAAPGTPQSLTHAALDGLSLIEADTEAEEADAIALLMREALETPNKTAALISPDSGLARRVSALLQRWDIHVAPSAGWPLLQTRAGRFFIAALNWSLDSGDPLALARLLKHELMVFGDDEMRERGVSALERGMLRSLRGWTDLDSLAVATGKRGDEAEKKPKHSPIEPDDYGLALHLLEDLYARVGDDLADLAALSEGEFKLRPFIEKLAELCDRLTRHPDDEGPSLLWSGQDGSALARCLEDAAQMGDAMPDIRRDDLAPLLTQFANDLRVPDDMPSHPRLNIWGPLEARLQRSDLLILSSLNEGSWPEMPSVDGFLPRQIRASIGLPDTEARIGLSAHDFAQLACAPNVILTRSQRVDDKPAVASRWLWRLRILVSSALESLEKTDERLNAPTAYILDWVRGQHAAKPAEDVLAPRPKPPANKRTEAIRVTDVENLIRDPYAFYAKTILKLEPLDPINPPLSPMAVGIAMHKALEKFDTLKTPYISTGQMVDSFATQLEAVGADDLFIAERQAGWAEGAAPYIDWLVSRDGHVKARKMEVDYNLDLAIGSGKVLLTGRADMVETLEDNTLSIIDFKTGNPPSNKQVMSGLSPQLPLLAAMAAHCTDEDKPSGTPSELFYVGFGSKPGIISIEDKKEPKTAQDMADAAIQGLQDLLFAYSNSDMPYLSGPRIQFQRAHGDYDGLSRKQEWADPGHEGGSEGNS